MLRTAGKIRAVNGKVSDMEKYKMAEAVAKAKSEMLNWSRVKCTLKAYAMLEAPWARRAVRLAVCFAAENVSDLAGV